jgi:hypothetical protein
MSWNESAAEEISMESSPEFEFESELPDMVWDDDPATEVISRKSYSESEDISEKDTFLESPEELAELMNNLDSEASDFDWNDSAAEAMTEFNPALGSNREMERSIESMEAESEALGWDDSVLEQISEMEIEDSPTNVDEEDLDFDALSNDMSNDMSDVSWDELSNLNLDSEDATTLESVTQKLNALEDMAIESLQDSDSLLESCQLQDLEEEEREQFDEIV